MRKQKKEQIMEIMTLLEQAHSEIRKQLKDTQIQQAIGLLEDCQNAAVSVGTQIERSEGEGFQTVALLERYCEQAYILFEAISHIEYTDMSDSMKGIQEQLDKLDGMLGQSMESLEKDVPIRREVVFLPYKASMWDSLESVWKAVDEDPEFDAYVIPIPYFDRNADGSFGKMHYEGKMYPEYVPITDYRTFDLKEHRPDMIFIHNPYDDCNLITSVPPRFFSANLKAYTEKLIYIPYFVLPEISVEKEAEVVAIADFCKVPAVFHADKVIVQSEQMKQVYVKVLTKWKGEATRFYWEEKILGLGSPKMDKVVNTKREDVEIPKEWKSVIYRKDGSCKKVVFYNTSINGLLKYRQSYLRKIEEVLCMFREQQGEVALLWRPHPLIETVMRSLEMETAEKYQQLVSSFKAEGWGIFDETPDLDRAIALADAYYGDPSSVVQLCQKAGIPVMLQKVESTWDNKLNG